MFAYSNKFWFELFQGNRAMALARTGGVELDNTRPHSNPSGCSWLASWLVTFAVDDWSWCCWCFPHSPSLSLPHSNSSGRCQQEGKTQGPDVTDATVRARGAPTPPGTAISASFGCAIRESGTLFYAVAAQHLPERLNINTCIVIVILPGLYATLLISIINLFSRGRC